MLDGWTFTIVQTNGQNEPACLVFVMMKVVMFFVMASVALCLESGLIYCGYNNILYVQAEAISMAICVSFVNYFFCELFL
jgi:hypothetical protein